MEVIVNAGSRLHAGFHIIGDKIHRIEYAGAGFYVEKPNIRVVVKDCGEATYDGPPDFGDPVTFVIEKTGFTGCVQLEKAPRRHIGLGSTTQVMLAVYHGIKLLRGEGIGGRDLLEAGFKLLERTKASTVGTLLYAYGGFVSGVGLPLPSDFSVLRLPVPSDWRFVIVIPDIARGLSEEEERRYLGLPKPAPQRVKQLMAIGFHYLVMGVVRRDLDLVLDGLKSMQTATGLYFSSIQGGVYRSDVARIVDEASRDGIVLAQSSWGPTLYTITTPDSAESDKKTLEMIMREVGVRGEVIVSSPRNMGGGPNSV
ncbi:MAG: hypothetical protein F7C37_06660 [Desulfurococcales archaeon]|nr:hypothetical protein [Desulfurococcales archaeon]